MTDPHDCQKTDGPKILVAIPVYNEERYVLPVIEEVAKFAHCVLVVDDGSTDATPTLLARLPVEVVRHRTNRGYGRSIRDAFLWAQTYDYDWLITMDCDEQHEPASLPDFFEAIKQDDADVISGSRYLDDKRCGTPPPEDRRAINTSVTRLVNDRLGLSITDAFCGFKAYRVSGLADLKLDVDGYALPLQFWVQHAASQHRIKEVPIKLIYNDPNRSFGGPLDDPKVRIKHYMDVFESELAKYASVFGQADEQEASAVQASSSAVVA